ncbi:MAG: aminomethyl-transferring glycine dehydrogenase, partial [Verrucomicrobiota bacterium]|nr:aminomethyl-transferring glycine dehydrogenase [Verrucomicrobiota bacterium]
MDTVDTATLAKPASTRTQTEPLLERFDAFARRHIGLNGEQIDEMLKTVGAESLDALIDLTVPKSIRLSQPLNLPPAKGEREALEELRAIASKNRVMRSFIGAGYSDCVTPPVIQRNILENPGWYTAYTPYQAEIAQGRLEALVNFQTMITDLTALDMANASMLDEATAAAEAMTLCRNVVSGRDRFFVSDRCHPQTIQVVQTRAKPLGLEVVVGDHATFDFTQPFFAALLQYPATDGEIIDYSEFTKRAHDAGALVIVAADLLSLTVLRAPGEFGADVAVGNTQRFGVPLGFGGPHAAYLATKDAYKRHMPGRLVGVSHAADGKPGYRLALQTREQHIRRDKATSNICTAQVLLAVMASMYAVYHGPRGLRAIAERVHGFAAKLAEGLEQLGFEIAHEDFFDTIRVELGEASSKDVLHRAEKHGINLRSLGEHTVGIALDETTRDEDLEQLMSLFRGTNVRDFTDDELTGDRFPLPEALIRTSEYLTHPVFNTYETETEMLRYLRRLEARDLSLTTSMIPLGSCTMKLNATAEMFPVSWPEFAKLHPFAPESQTAGYREMCDLLALWLARITGFAAVSLQPNAGSQGEYAGLLAIRSYHEARGQGHRKVCLIPQSAHGTNPASAVMAGFKVVPVVTSKEGDIDLADLRVKADQHADDLAALMVTYPSTHGVFEPGIRDVCEIVHSHGGQVYMDGANMNAQVGLCRPGDFGPDVCHLNLHKTFCIPHGGGGPGMGPIGVAKHLAPFLPDGETVGPVSQARFGSASILTISWMYIRMMGPIGLT